MRIKIIADSTCDLSFDLMKLHDIRMAPLTIVMGGQGYKDSYDIAPEDIFAFVETGGGISHTTAVSVGEYLTIYGEEKAAGADAIIHFTISGELSACHDNALVAARDFERVYPIDTRSLSTGSGWLVLYAVDLIAAGLSAEEVVARCEAKKQLIEASFVISTLDYLHKGGRCSGVAALSAGLLNIKPCLELRQGKIEVARKYRGKIGKVIERYLRDRLSNRDDIEPRRALLTHTLFDEPELVAEAFEIAKKLYPFEELILTSAGCTVSNHCGPGTLGILFCRREPV
ncbi:MAG: DegV family protein [Coriobacteriales bacterium]|jgi:DegV family protein with EDD domain|nr:DegV family protein [Coriobacteriales bacterium]